MKTGFQILGRFGALVHDRSQGEWEGEGKGGEERGGEERGGEGGEGRIGLFSSFLASG